MDPLLILLLIGSLIAPVIAFTTKAVFIAFLASCVLGSTRKDD